MEVIKKNRVVWVDLYKAFAIILVVIGHATGKYNCFIYQFHLAAFFFISGYVTDYKKENLWGYMVKKIYTLLFPLVMMLILFDIMMSILDKVGAYENCFGVNMPYVGFGKVLYNFFTTGGIYTWWLGAAWFIEALFLITILHRVCFILAGKKKIFLALYTLLFYLIGYYFVRHEITLGFMLDVVLIAQFFYSVGYLFNQYNIFDKIEQNKIIIVTLFLTTSAFMFACSKIPEVTIDYVSRGFHHIGLNTLTSLNGILWLFALSVMWSWISIKRIRDLFLVVGRNTLGVVFFHFCFFKMGYLVMIRLGKMKWEEFCNLVPPEIIGNNYWPFFTLIAIVGSTLIYCLMIKIKIFRITLGQDKEFLKRLTSKLKIQRVQHKQVSVYVSTIGSLLLLIILGSGVGKIYYDEWKQMGEKIEITFPYAEDGNATFKEGWIQQGEDETYRWVRKESELLVKSKKKSNFSLTGYVPEEFSEVKKLKVEVNGVEVETIDLTGQPNFEIQEDISYIDNVDNTYCIQLKFDNEHIPQKEDADQRIMAAMVLDIQLN